MDEAWGLFSQEAHAMILLHPSSSLSHYILGRMSHFERYFQHAWGFLLAITRFCFIDFSPRSMIFPSMVLGNFSAFSPDFMQLTELLCMSSWALEDVVAWWNALHFPKYDGGGEWDLWPWIDSACSAKTDGLPWPAWQDFSELAKHELPLLYVLSWCSSTPRWLSIFSSVVLLLHPGTCKTIGNGCILPASSLPRMTFQMPQHVCSDFHCRQKMQPKI